jgi:hypothetical protein
MLGYLVSLPVSVFFWKRALAALRLLQAQSKRQ